MRFKRLLSATLAVVMMSNLVVGQISASAAENTTIQDVYLDGVAYHFEVDEDWNIIVTAETAESEARMVLDQDLNGTVEIENANAADEEYTVDIKSLNAEEEVFDVAVVDETNPEETLELEYEDIADSDYSGQVAVTAGGVIVLGGLLEALLYAALAVVIAGVTCIAVVAAVEAVKKASNCYYLAYQVLNSVFINPVPISQGTAVSTLKAGGSVYTFTGTRAYTAVYQTGLGVIGPENSYAWYKIGDYFWHYHPGNRNGAHCWYGLKT